VYAWCVHGCARASFRPPSRHVSPLRSHGTRSFGSLSLATRDASYCVRTPSTGRLDVQEGLLRNMQSCLRDVEGTLYVLMDALLDMPATTSARSGRCMPPRCARSRTGRSRRRWCCSATAPRPRRAYTSSVRLAAPWLDGMRLEESLDELRALLDTPAAAMAAEPAQASYVAGQVSACYATRVSWARPVGMMGAPLSRSRRRVGGYSPCGGGGARVADSSTARSAAHGGTCLFHLSPPE